jgi:hypothetical protein
MEGSIYAALVIGIASLLMTWLLHLTHGLTHSQQAQLGIIYGVSIVWASVATWKWWKARGKAPQPVTTTPPTVKAVQHQSEFQLLIDKLENAKKRRSDLVGQAPAKKNRARIDAINSLTLSDGESSIRQINREIEQEEEIVDALTKRIAGIEK